MRNRLRNIFCVVVAVVAAAACSTTQKIIKSGDTEYIYARAVELYNTEHWSKANKLLENVEFMFVGTFREDTIAYYKARCQAKMGDYYTAIDLIDQFRREYAHSKFIEDAESMRAMCYYYLSPGPTRDQTTTNQAMSAAYEFMARYPESTKNEGFQDIVDELKTRLYEKSFVNAYTYYKIGKYKSSIIAFRNAIKEYPESHRREDILYYIVASSYELAKNSVPSKQLDRYISMLDAYYTFIAEFPESKEYSKDVAKMAKEANKFIEENQDKSQAPEAEQPAAPQM